METVVPIWWSHLRAPVGAPRRDDRRRSRKRNSDGNIAGRGTRRMVSNPGNTNARAHAARTPAAAKGVEPFFLRWASLSLEPGLRPGTRRGSREPPTRGIYFRHEHAMYVPRSCIACRGLAARGVQPLGRRPGCGTARSDGLRSGAPRWRRRTARGLHAGVRFYRLCALVLARRCGFARDGQPRLALPARPILHRRGLGLRLQVAARDAGELRHLASRQSPGRGLAARIAKYHESRERHLALARVGLWRGGRSAARNEAARVFEQQRAGIDLAEDREEPLDVFAHGALA